MKAKACNKCGNEFPATTEYYYAFKGTKDGVHYTCKNCVKDYQRSRYKKNKKHVIRPPKEKPTHKKCSCCKKTLPLTKEYFFEKKIKQLNKDGQLKTYHSFRSNCKKCHAAKGQERRIKKRCKELGCEVHEYRKHWKMQYSKARSIDMDAQENLSLGQYQNYKKRLRSGETYNWKHYIKTKSKRRKEAQAKRPRKYNTKQEAKTAQRKQNKVNQKISISNLDDGYVARLLGFKRTELPSQIIESKRMIIKIKRELNYKNIKIK